MYITVKFGPNVTIRCNPHCMAINLLHYIRQRAGYGNNVHVDLSDVQGLVKDLLSHPWDDASKHLVMQETYVLIERRVLPLDDLSDTSSVISDITLVPHIIYVPLLDRCEEIYQGFRLRNANDESRDERKTPNTSSSAAAKQHHQLASARSSGSNSVAGSSKTSSSVAGSSKTQTKRKSVSKHNSTSGLTSRSINS